MDLNKKLTIAKAMDDFRNEQELRKQDIILKLSVVLNVKLDEVKKIWESE